jgi:ketosteroid isomerase-like protein
MSQANVDAFKRAVEAMNRGDIEAALNELDPEVEWHPALPVLLRGEAVVYRGHDGVREFFREVRELWSEVHYEISLIEEADDRVVAVGRIRIRDRESDAESEALVGYICLMRRAKVIRIWGFLDPKEALKAAGLRE